MLEKLNKFRIVGIVCVQPYKKRFIYNLFSEKYSPPPPSKKMKEYPLLYNQLSILCEKDIF